MKTKKSDFSCYDLNTIMREIFREKKSNYCDKKGNKNLFYFLTYFYRSICEMKNIFCYFNN